MKKFIAVMLCLALTVSVFTGCTTTPPAGNSTNSPAPGGSSDAGSAPGGSGDTIKIGIFEPASGENGGGGKQEALGIRYAHSLVPTVEVGGKTYKVELVEVDNQSDTSKAVTAAQSLVSSGVSVVLGSYGSGVSIAAGEIFREAKIPAIGVSCTNPQVTLGNDYYFRICFLDPFQGTVMASFAQSKGAKKAFVITQLGDDYSTGLGNYFKSAFEAAGGAVVTGEFQTGEVDFNAILTNAKNENVDVIFAPSSIATAPLIIQQARQLGITCPIMAGDTWENQSIIDNAGADTSEVYLSTFFDENDSSNTIAKDFVTGYKAWLNSDNQNLTNTGGNDGVAAVSALGYDAYMTAIEAIKAAGAPDAASIQAALPGVSYDGVTGGLTFDENGDAKKNMAYIKTIDNGGFKFIQTQTVS